jgi:hypothetical protein
MKSVLNLNVPLQIPQMPCTGDQGLKFKVYTNFSVWMWAFHGGSWKICITGSISGISCNRCGISVCFIIIWPVQARTHGATPGSTKRLERALWYSSYTNIPHIWKTRIKSYTRPIIQLLIQFSTYILSGTVTSQLRSYPCLRFAVHQCTNITQIFP